MKFRTLFVATAVLFAGSVPALAAPKPIRMSAKSFATPETKVCMPKSVLGRNADRTLPETICDTQAGWEARGVVFDLRK